MLPNSVQSVVDTAAGAGISLTGGGGGDIKAASANDPAEDRSKFHHIRGRCGPLFKLTSGEPSICPPEAGTCCSEEGWCSFDPEDCICEQCTFYEFDKAVKYLEPVKDLVDDNSELTIRNFTFTTIEPTFDCNSGEILIVVMTTLHNFQVRQLVRETWGNLKYLEKMSAKIMFVVGHYPNQENQNTLQREADKFGDILQADFKEDYYTLSLKSLSWMYWARKKDCKIPWLVKTDDDMIPDIWTMEKIVNEMKGNNSRNEFVCHAKTDPVLRGGKWEVKKEDFARDTYPTNCWGPVYFFHREVRDKLVQSFEEGDGKVIRVDDVYITGILAEPKNITHRQIKHIVSGYSGWKNNELLSGQVRFAHLPSDATSSKRRFWLWRRIVENQFPAAEAAALLDVDYTKFSLTPIVPTTTTLEAPSKKKKKSKSNSKSKSKK